MLTEVFWSFFLTSTIGCILGLVKMLYKSKCKRCTLCGISVERDVELEEKIDELEMERVKAKNDEESNKEMHGV
jgi:hypothetical protein